MHAGSPLPTTEADVAPLLSLEKEELLELLGMQAVPLLSSPLQTKEILESDALKVEYEAILGSARKKRKPVHSMVQLGRRFLKTWAQELRAAICENIELHKQERQTALKDTHLMVAAVVGAIIATVPQLALLSGLLTIVGVMVATSGIAAFCKSLL